MNNCYCNSHCYQLQTFLAGPAQKVSRCLASVLEYEFLRIKNREYTDPSRVAYIMSVRASLGAEIGIDSAMQAKR